MPRHRDPKLHAFNFSTGKAVCGRQVEAVCGRQVERSGTLVASDVLDVTCQVCTVELDRWARQVSDLVEAAGPKVFPSILSNAGVGTEG